MKLRTPALVALALVAGAGAVEARNPHCAGGIQYVSQAMKDKAAGNMDDYKREIGKAIQQLNICVAEDPNDIESYTYLGIAYAEADSAAASGQAFGKAIDGLTAKGKKKELESAVSYRDNYWTSNWNEGIRKVAAGQDKMKTVTKENEAVVKSEANALFEQGAVNLTKASQFRPNHPNTIRNLASAYVFLGQPARAEQIVQDGLKAMPGDTTLTQALKAIRGNTATQLIDEKKYDQAIAQLTELAKAEPNNLDVQFDLGRAYLERGQTKEGDARKSDLKAAGAAFAKAAEGRPEDADVAYNTAIAYHNAGEWALAETYWRRTLKLKPTDATVMGDLAVALNQQAKYAEALQIMHQAVMANPKDVNNHRNFAAIYSKAGNTAKATEELMVFLALSKGKPVDDAAAAAKAAKGAGVVSTLAKMGPPDQVIPWEVDQDKVESWFYWSKNTAFHFKGGEVATKSDWSAPDLKTATSAPKK